MPILRPYDPIGLDPVRRFHDDQEGLRDGAQPPQLPGHGLRAGEVGQVLDGMDEVVAYTKNQGLNFKVLHTLEGEAANYVPDLIVRVDDGATEPLNLIIEVTGEHRREKAAAVATR